jgi:hypothetical protein
LKPPPVAGMVRDSGRVAAMSNDEAVWKRCSTCKKPIGFAGGYYVCSVSTCNRRAALYVFCSVGCWDGHVPVMRHRDAWAVEATAPTAAEWVRQQAAERAPDTRLPPSDQPNARAPRRVVVGGPSNEGDRSPHAQRRDAAGPRDVLIVVSKHKHYVRETTGMNTSDDVIEVLSDRVRELCDAAVEQARAAGRKTIMARDFRRRPSD